VKEFFRKQEGGRLLEKLGSLGSTKMSENSVSGSNLRPPKYNGNGGRAFVVF
jgi:hypothetical protein